ncbi:MAG TPA: uroporphyrinogen decarboxylase family protein [Anaerolineales bacterium]|nr:uroporphyrinogen decarboxylase family protein [Anaerolineales bacterium]
MNSRERVRAALNHRPPDRVPIDLGGSIVTGINAMAYARLKRHLGLPGPVRVSSVILLLAEVEEDLIERWGVDVLPVPRYYAAPGVPLAGGWREHPLPDGTPGLFPRDFAPRLRADGAWELLEGGEAASIMSPGSGSFVPARFPLAGAGLEELEFLHRTARRLYGETDKALFGWFNGSIFEQSQFLCGWDEFMVRLAADVPFADRLLEKLTEAALADLGLYLQAVGPYLEAVGFGDDFGSQGGLQISPAMFRERIKPHLARIYAAAHAGSKAKVFLHSCGSVVELIEDFIQIGVDVLNPVQTSAAGMEPEGLKRRFGGRMVFWGGGADVQRILPLGSPSEVRRDVRRRLEIFAPDGGFVFAPIHNLQADVPPENVEAMYEEAAKG